MVLSGSQGSVPLPVLTRQHLDYRCKWSHFEVVLFATWH